MTAPDHALEPFKKTTCTKGGIHTCTNRVKDSLCESSVIAVRHEQLSPHEIQDQELVILQ